MSKKFFQLVDLINSLTKSKALELEDKVFLQKTLKCLGQAISVNNSREIEKLVDKISKALLKKIV